MNEVTRLVQFTVHDPDMTAPLIGINTTVTLVWTAVLDGNDSGGWIAESAGFRGGGETITDAILDCLYDRLGGVDDGSRRPAAMPQAAEGE